MAAIRPKAPSKVARQTGRQAMPVSPYRRLDSAAIGSLAAGYPCGIFEASDRRLLETAEYLMEQCSIDGAFLHDIGHSGINPYLSLHIAQVLLRAGDARCLDVFNTVSGLASATGQWLEAIHPRTKGGCMGDGQHIWAVAEWLLMACNAFVHEEGKTLMIGGGIPPEWIRDGRQTTFGPAPTVFGPVSVFLEPEGDGARIRWEDQWRAGPPAIEVRLPGQPKVKQPGQANSVFILSEELGSRP